jgi:small nuclear ribonucleoprotein (snRNP)-like protein
MEDVLREGQVMEGVFQAFQSYKNIVLKHTKILTGVHVFGRIMPVCRNR